jgi:two-component system response regulator YesN
VKKVLLVDDERSFIESLALLVKRELPEEFEVVGFASSGREAIEKAATLSPEIVVMDLRMPGISGLDAIREMRSRGPAPVFILVTAYERFDTALEAVSLGVADYLIKPVAKDRLFLSLRTAALAIDRRNELERRIIEQREREEGLRPLVEASFLQAIMLGERSRSELGKYLSALGLEERRALVGAASFPAPSLGRDPGGDARSAYEAFCRTVRYKSRALAGPLVSGHCAVYLPLGSDEGAEEAKAALYAALEAAQGGEIARARVSLHFAPPVAVEDSASAWAEAVRSLLGEASAASGEGGAAFDEEEAFLEAIAELSPERASLALERLCLAIGPRPVPEAWRFRMATLLGTAYRTLAGKGVLGTAEAEEAFRLSDIAGAEDGECLRLAVRARLTDIEAAIARSPRSSNLVQGAISYIESNYGRQITLESVAESLAISPNRLARILASELGKGFSELLIEYRIERAKVLLSRPKAVIKQVCVTCGYSDQNYFSRLFKKKTGLTPSVFSDEAARAKG